MTRDVAELAQSVERTTLNRVVVGSIPTFGAKYFIQCAPNNPHLISILREVSLSCSLFSTITIYWFSFIQRIEISFPRYGTIPSRSQLMKNP